MLLRQAAKAEFIGENEMLGVRFAGRGVARLHKTGLVHDQHSAVGAEVIGNVGANVVADGVGVPAGVAQQALHRPGPGATGLFGQPPAVLPLGFGQHPEQVGAGSHSGLDSAESSRNLGHGLVEHLPPAGRVHAMACGHRTIFRSPHNPRDHSVAAPVPSRTPMQDRETRLKYQRLSGANACRPPPGAEAGFRLRPDPALPSSPTAGSAFWLSSPFRPQVSLTSPPTGRTTRASTSGTA
jgi:hypothetical protein